MIKDGAVYLYWACFSDFVDVHATLLEKLDKVDRDKYFSYRNIIVRNKFLVSRALLRIILSLVVNVLAEDIVLDYGPHGKPYLKDSDLYFNVSHSSEMLVVAVSGKCVGVDIESLDRKVDFNQIMSKFFNLSEINDWKSCSAQMLLERFLLGWTRKEAVLKATGDGITGIRDLIVPFDQNKSVEEANYKGDIWYLHNFAKIPGHIVSIASCYKECSINDFRLDKTLKIDLM